MMPVDVFLPTSITDGHDLSQLFGEDEDKEEKDTDEGGTDAFLDQLFLFNDATRLRCNPK